jgi:hypothetical protein
MRPWKIQIYPHPDVRIRHKTGDPVGGVASSLHSDQPGSVRVATDSGQRNHLPSFSAAVDTSTAAPTQTLNKSPKPLNLSTVRPVNHGKPAKRQMQFR